jgi:ABC-type multidrug transport system ATPase subunit
MEEADACHRIAILDQGHVVAMGEPAQLKAQVPQRFVRQRLASLAVDHATLEDVFVQKAGHHFE